MKVLLINNFYYNRGGDCTYLFSLQNVLKDMGHEICIFSMDHPDNFDSEYLKYFVSYINYNEEIEHKNIASGFKVLRRTIYSREARKKIKQLIISERPDVAHIQNIHHHITPSIFFELKKHNVPIIWTLHDYTLICPNTSFLSHGEVCEKCKKHKYYWPLIQRCKKESFAASAITALEAVTHKVMRVHDMVDTLIAPSIFLRDKLLEYGFPERKIAQLNNLSCLPIDEEEDNKFGEYFVYIGRISPEKGVKTLVDATLKAYSEGDLVNKIKLKIIGGGPLKLEMLSYVKSKNASSIIDFLGHQSHEEVMRLLKNSSFAVLPSECYENFPYSIIEAFSSAKPVIGSRIGGIPELVKNWETGLLFRPGDINSLSLKIKFFMNHPEQAVKMGKEARTFVQNELNAVKHYEGLINIYKQVSTKEKLII